jgi:hypothetical protein
MAQLTIHHLTPRQAVKRKQAEPGETVAICAACHRQIHAFFNNRELAQNLNTIEKLRHEPKMQKFLQWLRKQNSSKKIRVNRHR